MEPIALLLAAALNAGTVLAIAALGLLINEKAGVVNLGAEGMMLVSAIAGFAAVVHTGSDIAGFAAGMAAGAALAAVFGVLVVWLNTNAYATGLALSLFGAGFAAFAGIGYVQAKLPERAQFAIPGLADLPFVGPAPFRQHPMGHLTVALTIALALTTFATWRPARVLLGAYLFGGVTMLQFHPQSSGVQVPSQFLNMLPYVSTIFVLALISQNPRWIRGDMSASLGKPFTPGS